VPTGLFTIVLPAVWALNELGLPAAAHLPFWLGPFLLYLVIPLADRFIGPDGENPPDEVLAHLENDRYYRYLTYLYLPFQYAGLVMACYLLTAGDLSWLGIAGGLHLADKIGLTVTIGLVGGIGINTAHELGHKKVDLERWLSRIALAQTGYGHFYIEHNRGHHVRVATQEDPASSRLGESFWEFLPRTVKGSLVSAWRLEKARLERLGTGPWTWRNEVLQAWAMTVALYALLVAVFGIGLLPWLLVQAVFGFSLLEVVNYLEHYGLARQRTGSWRYERPAPTHSWHRAHLVTNVFLSHPPLPDAAQLGRRAEPARGLRHHDHAGLRSAAVAPGDGQAGAGPLRRRRHPGEHPSAHARAGAGRLRRAGRAMSAFRCPVCEYVYDETRGDPHEGFPAGTPWESVPDDWCCPDCGVREKIDFEPMGATG